MNLIISNHTISQDKNGFFSLNDLHKVSGGASKHQPSNFMRNAETQELIKEIELEKSNSSNLMSIAYTTTEGKKGGHLYAVNSSIATPCGLALSFR